MLDPWVHDEPSKGNFNNSETKKPGNFFKKATIFAFCVFVAVLFVLTIKRPGPYPEEDKASFKAQMFLHQMKLDNTCWTDVDKKDYIFIKNNKSSAVFHGYLTRSGAHLLQDLPGEYAVVSRELEVVMTDCYKKLRQEESDNLTNQQAIEYQNAIDLVVNEGRPYKK